MRKASRAVVKAPRYWAMTRVTTLSQPWPLGWRVPRRRDTWSMASVERDSRPHTTHRHYRVQVAT